MYTVKMNAPALRSLMGDAFDYTLFEQGRQDARARLTDSPDKKTEFLEQTRRALENGSFAHTPGPSYWVGCLSELDFV